MKLFAYMLTLLVALPVISANATDANMPEVVPFGVSRAYVPQGFDSNDPAQLVVEGVLPNTCYRVGPHTVTVNQETKEIVVNQSAYIYKGDMCLQMLVPFNLTVNVGILKTADYTVKDSVTSRNLGVLPVSSAKNAGPDDYNYAIVNDAYVDYIPGGQRAIILHGQLPGTCWHIAEKRTVQESKDVVTLLPILEFRDDGNCEEVQVPFVTTARLPDGLEAGRHMLHVRSQNGASVNKLFDIY